MKLARFLEFFATIFLLIGALITLPFRFLLYFVSVLMGDFFERRNVLENTPFHPVLYLEHGCPSYHHRHRRCCVHSCLGNGIKSI